MKKKLTASEWLLKQAKRHKRRNFLYINCAGNYACVISCGN